MNRVFKKIALYAIALTFFSTVGYANQKYQSLRDS